MSAADKFDNKLDAWLGQWPVSDRSQPSWDALADRIQKKIAASPSAPSLAVEACFASPCPSEPGEGSLASARVSGGLSMSEEAAKPRSDETDNPRSDEADKSAADKPDSSTASADKDTPADGEKAVVAAVEKPAVDAEPAAGSEPDKPKRSLKDFAKRVSVAPPAPASSASPSVPPSAPASTRPPASTRTPLPITSRPVEAKPSDSGVVDLKAVREQSNSVPDAGTAPASTGLFEEDDDKKPAAAALTAKPDEIKSSMSPVFKGSIIALVAIAAVTIFAIRSRNADSPVASAPVAASAPAAQPPAVVPAENNPGAAAQASAATPASSTASATTPLAMARNDETKPSGAAEAKGGGDKQAKADEAKDKVETTATATATAAPPPADPGNLGSAMDKAVGGGAATPKPDEPATKSAGPMSADVPEIPSQGAIQGALGSVMGAARACVSGMDEPSRAQITFGSNGNVLSVSVSGAASGKPAAGCIVAALKRAKVTPFQKSSFSVGATIRP